MTQPTNINLIKMIRSILNIPKDKEITCPECEGTGLDEAHKWPDGSFASCAECQGYGTIRE